MVSGADVFFSIGAADVTISTVMPLLNVTGDKAIQKSVAVVAFIAVLLHSNVMLLPAFSPNSIVGIPSAEQFIVAVPLSFSSLLPLMIICLIDTISSALFNCSLRNPNTFLKFKALSLLEEVTATIGREPSPKEPLAYVCVLGIFTLRAWLPLEPT